jgi:hypothetical protein
MLSCWMLSRWMTSQGPPLARQQPSGMQPSVALP